VKPHVICHMASSLDGRILPHRWRPYGLQSDIYEDLHDQFRAQAWLVGRVTGQEFTRAKSYPANTEETFPREAWLATRGASAYGVVLDAHGKIAWGLSEIGGDPIVVVLTESVSDAHLAGLRADGVSYIFAGKTRLELRRVLDILNKELGIERLLLEGGGVANGSFLREGLVDELSLILWPAIDGAAVAPGIFEAAPDSAHADAPLRAMRLLSAERLPDNAVWLRYAMEPSR
jgi:riboflavin biosynthesis pyrimidine reductase